MIRLIERLAIGETNTEITVTKANGARKMLWQENLLGKALRHAGFDVRVPGFTGWPSWTIKSHNIILNIAHAWIALTLGGDSVRQFSTIGIGTDATTPDPTQSELLGFVVAAPATVTYTTTTVQNDTVILTAALTLPSACTISESGIKDTLANPTGAGGSWLARQSFTAIPCSAGDVITIVHQYAC